MSRKILTILISIFMCLSCMAQISTKIPGKTKVSPTVKKPVVIGTPVVIATPVAVVTGPTCDQANEENCLAESDLGEACREKFPEQCRPFLQESLEEEVSQISNSQVTIAPFSLDQQGAETEALVKNAPPVSNLSISGMSQTFQALQIPAYIGKYKLAEFGTITPSAAASISTSSPILVGTPTPSTSKVATSVASATSGLAVSSVIVSVPTTIVHKPELLSKIKIQTALDKHERWEGQSGYESCEEFVYERFAHLSALEEKASELRTDPIAIFKFIRSKNWLNHNYFIPQYPETGRLFIGNWIADPDWKPYYNNPIMRNLDENGNWYKNAFTSYDISKFEESTITPSLVNLVSYNLNARTNLSLENQIYMYQLLHANNISDEYLEQMQDLGAQYLAKLEERIATYKEYTKAKSDADYICMLPAGAGGGPSNCDAAQQQAANKLVEVKARLIPIDGEISNMLTLAKNVGCFEGDNIKCDWAPSIALKTLDWGLHKYKKRREEEFEMCNLALKSQITSGSNQYVIPQDDYRWIVTNPTYAKHFRYPTQGWKWKNYAPDFIKFMEFAWQYYYQIQAEMKEVKKFAQIDHPTLSGKKQVGNMKSDNGFYGTDNLGGIGAGYAYSAGWMLKDYESQIYRANVESFSTFALTGKIFGYDVNIVDYSGETHTTNTRSVMDLRLKIMDKNWVPAYGKNMTSGYHFVIDSTREDKLFSKHTYINVFGVPLRLEAGAYARAGFKSDLTTTFSRSSSDDSLTLNSNGSFQPYSALTAYASVAVDQVVARIGVRGRLDLLTLGLPLDINHTIQKRNPDFLPAISTDTKLGIEFGTLSGRFSAFMDTILGDLEMTIFRWNGLSYTHNLFTSKTENPFSLKIARRALGIEQ